MKRLLSAVAAMAMTSSVALAADPVEYMAPAPAFSWEGFYAGAHAGYGFAGREWTLVDNASTVGACGRCGTVVADFDLGGFLGGVQAGYNYQMDEWVFGVEADFSLIFADGRGTWQPGAGAAVAGTRDVVSDLDWIATLGPRVGWAMDRTLLYVEGGLAVSGETLSHTNFGNGNVFEDDDIDFGWFLGAGVEHALDDDWSVKLEYNYASLDDDSARLDFIGVPGGNNSGRALFDVDRGLHLVKLGVNYRF